MRLFLTLLPLSKLLYKSGRKIIELKVWESWSYQAGSIIPFQHVLSISMWEAGASELSGGKRWSETSIKRWGAPGSHLCPCTHFSLVGGELWGRNAWVEKDWERQETDTGKMMWSRYHLSLDLLSPLFTSFWMLNSVYGFMARFTKHHCQAHLKQRNCICFHLPHIKAVSFCFPTYFLIDFMKGLHSLFTVGSGCSGQPTKTLPALGKLHSCPRWDTNPWVTVRQHFD